MFKKYTLPALAILLVVLSFFSLAKEKPEPASVAFKCPETDEEVRSTLMALAGTGVVDDILIGMQSLSEKGCYDAVMRMNLMMTREIEAKER